MLRQPSVINILNKMNTNKNKNKNKLADDKFYGEGRPYFPYTFQYDPKKKFTYTPLPLPLQEIEEKLQKTYDDLSSVWGKDKFSFRKTTTKNGVKFIIRMNEEGNSLVNFGKL